MGDDKGEEITVKSKIKNQKSKINPKSKCQMLKFLFWDFGIWICFVIWILAFVIHSDVYAQSISSIELINNAKEYDGKTVTYSGEAIGDIMIRGKYAWVNINDGNIAIGIWMEADLAKEVIYTGSYASKGDWVSVSGVFHRACLEHGGDLDVHAATMERVTSGEKISKKINRGKVNLAAFLLSLLILIWILKLLRRK